MPYRTVGFGADVTPLARDFFGPILREPMPMYVLSVKHCVVGPAEPLQLGSIGAAQASHLAPIDKEFERGHRADTIVLRKPFILVHIHLDKIHRLVFRGESSKVGSNPPARHTWVTN
jgi:hypothetical protein